MLCLLVFAGCQPVELSRGCIHRFPPCMQRRVGQLQIDLTHRDQLTEILTQITPCMQAALPYVLAVRPPAAAHSKAPRGRTAPSCSPASVLSTSGRCTFRGWAHCAICAAAIVVWLSGGASATTRTCSWEAAKALLQQPLPLLRRLRVGTGSSRCHPGLFPCRPMRECALLAHPSRPGSGCGWLRWAAMGSFCCCCCSCSRRAQSRARTGGTHHRP